MRNCLSGNKSFSKIKNYLSFSLSFPLFFSYLRICVCSFVTHSLFLSLFLLSSFSLHPGLTSLTSRLTFKDNFYSFIKHKAWEMVHVCVCVCACSCMCVYACVCVYSKLCGGRMCLTLFSLSQAIHPESL